MASPADTTATPTDLGIEQMARLEARNRQLADFAGAIMASSRDGIWDWNLQTDEVSFSSRWMGMLGYGNGEFRPHFDTVRKLLHPADQEPLRQALREHFDEHRPLVQTLRFIHKDGTWRWISLRGAAIRNADGRPVRLVGLNTDVTEARNAADSIRESEQRYRAIVMDQTELICRFRPDGMITFVNGAYCRYFGRSREELIGRSFFPPMPPEDLVVAEENLLALTPDHPSSTCEYRVLIGGEIRWQQWTDRGVFDEQGRLAEFQSVGRDITKQRKTEEALVLAKETAEAAAQAKSEFLANVSHEVRTPLNGIIGMTGFLLDTSLSEEQRDYAQTVRESAQALLAIVNDILDFSKIEAGRIDLLPSDFDLRRLVDDVVDLVDAAAADKRIGLSLQYNSGVPYGLMGDSGRLRQVLINLVANAVKFTPEDGRVKLQIGLTESRGDTAVLRFEVEDTGPGIAQNMLGKLFQPFSQVDSSSTRKHGGTGLGLVISRKIVEAMGGTIGVHSVEGEGSIFWFKVPLLERRAAEALLADTPITLPDPRELLHPRSIRPIRVLVAEDNITNQRVAVGVLTRLGFRADAVSSGREAAEAVAKVPYDVVLMDVQMPDMDGLEATAVIRRREVGTARRIPIVALTAHAMRGDREKALASGMDDYLTKPISPEEVRAAIMRAIPDLFVVDGAIRAPLSSPTPRPMKAFDEASLLARLGGDHELAREVVEIFIKDAPQQIAELRKTIGTDPAQFKRAAHKLKGGANSISAGVIGRTALALEKAAESGNDAEIVELMGALGRDLEDFREAVAKGFR